MFCCFSTRPANLVATIRCTLLIEEYSQSGWCHHHQKKKKKPPKKWGTLNGKHECQIFFQGTQHLNS